MICDFCTLIGVPLVVVCYSGFACGGWDLVLLVWGGVVCFSGCWRGDVLLFVS